MVVKGFPNMGEWEQRPLHDGEMCLEFLACGMVGCTGKSHEFMQSLM